MLKINGGAVTIEDSTFSQSSTSGVSINGGTNGTVASATISRTRGILHYSKKGVHVVPSGPEE
jgi:hypothetical protein